MDKGLSVFNDVVVSRHLLSIKNSFMGVNSGAALVSYPAALPSPERFKLTENLVVFLDRRQEMNA